jgi:probable rRNA maturation factor
LQIANCKLQMEVSNEQELLAVDEGRLREAVGRVLAEEGLRAATISLAIVDDATIRPLNARYLGHDYATDVLSFVLEQSDGSLEGEVIVSAETAIATAARFGWRPEDELLLYVIHGTLHLVGYDDLTPEALNRMRQRERHYCSTFGLEPRYQDEMDG